MIQLNLWTAASVVFSTWNEAGTRGSRGGHRSSRCGSSTSLPSRWGSDSEMGEGGCGRDGLGGGGIGAKVWTILRHQTAALRCWTSGNDEGRTFVLIPLGSCRQREKKSQWEDECSTHTKGDRTSITIDIIVGVCGTIAKNTLRLTRKELATRWIEGQCMGCIPNNHKTKKASSRNESANHSTAVACLVMKSVTGDFPGIQQLVQSRMWEKMTVNKSEAMAKNRFLQLAILTTDIIHESSRDSPKALGLPKTNNHYVLLNCILHSHYSLLICLLPFCDRIIFLRNALKPPQYLHGEGAGSNF